MHASVAAETVNFSFSPRPENVALARLVAGALASRCGLPEETVADVRLLVSEACTNAVRATTRCARDDAISLTCHVDGAFSVEVSDSGCGEGVPDDAGFPVPGTADGGYGIPLIRYIAQEAHFDRNDSGGTTVRMVVALFDDEDAA